MGAKIIRDHLAMYWNHTYMRPPGHVWGPYLYETTWSCVGTILIIDTWPCVGTILIWDHLAMCGDHTYKRHLSMCWNHTYMRPPGQVGIILIIDTWPCVGTILIRDQLAMCGNPDHKRYTTSINTISYAIFTRHFLLELHIKGWQTFNINLYFTNVSY